MPNFIPDHVRGCLLGGAVGDALGAPVEFMRLDEIRARFGAAGVTDMVPAYGRPGAITDDTQMTLFTAEGLLRARARDAEKGSGGMNAAVWQAYQRWYYTQGGRRPGDLAGGGWLLKTKGLFAVRAPGNTCIAAIAGQRAGSRQAPINASKGCGGVMRAAPCAFVEAFDPFDLGCDIAALTHGHPTGWLAAGAFALMIAHVAQCGGVRDSVQLAIDRLRSVQDHRETVAALLAALGLADAAELPTAERVEELGGGWIAEEALAIAAYCAMVHEDDFEAAVQLAVNHSGDSDTTGSMTGQLLGARSGEQAIPRRWLEALELRQEIAAVADDLAVGWRDGKEWGERYRPH